MQGLSLLLLLVGADPGEVEHFEKQVRPLLVKHCYNCHAADTKQKGGLALDTRAGWQRGGDSGPAIEPGDPDASLLIRAVRYDGDLRMPPKGRLSDAEIETLTTWVRRGAIDPRDGTSQAEAASAGRRHWAYQPVQAPALPAVRDAGWCWSDIDRFVRARQEQAGLRPVADASPHTLLRRIHFDLTGLPPTPEQLDAFVRACAAGSRRAAVARVIDELLASPHFGERWGRHWLDVARYAESTGSDNNYLLVDAWRYRDYVIDAFNRDKPYDRFIIEQLAGDLLRSEPGEIADDDELIIATGFLALGHPDAAKMNPQVRLDQIDEQIDVIGKALLATTVSCARCHDHKYDPIPTADYYALAGILSSTDLCKTVVYTKGKHTLERVNTGAPLRGYQQAPVDEFIQLQRDLYGGRQAVVRMGWEHNKLVEAARTAASAAERDRMQAEADRLRAEMNRRVAASRRAEERLRSFPPLPPMALAVRDGTPRDEAIRLRGEPDQLGPVVKRGFLSALAPAMGATAPINPKQSGRLELARWIASPRNPLTARVMVNRVWLHLFGAGIVPSVDNFGINGEQPSHPELLDHLAWHFQREGWSVKKLIRTIVLSRTYQLDSVSEPAGESLDADNRLLWRMNRRRLEAEVLRDAMLAFSGQLELRPRERSLTAELGAAAMRYVGGQVHFDSPHRSIYLPQPRGKTFEFIELFDGPDRQAVTGQRDATTVPSQALYLLNSPFVLQAARAAADRLLAEADLDDAGRIDRAFRLALGRPASAEDQSVARALLDRLAELDHAQRWTAFCQVLIASPEFRYLR